MSESAVSLALQWRTDINDNLESIESRLDDLGEAGVSQLSEHFDSLRRAVSHARDTMPCEDGVRSFAERVGDEGDHESCHEDCYGSDSVLLTTWADQFDRREAKVLTFNELSQLLVHIENKTFAEMADAFGEIKTQLEGGEFTVWHWID